MFADPPHRFAGGGWEPSATTSLLPTVRRGRASVSPFWRFGAVAALITLILDQLSKLWLIFGFDLGRRGLVPIAPMLDLVLTWNTGISYGLLPQDSELGRWVLFGIKLVAALVLSLWLARAGSRLTAVALGLIIGGALGNAIDRLAHGAVADFVLFHITTANWEFRWYVFNLADAAIVAGVVGLLAETLFPGRAAKAP
jgi:signal peptidase II